MSRDHDIADRLRRAANARERKAVAEEFARAHHTSLATVYRWAKTGGWSSERRRRGDAGQSRSGLTGQHVEIVGGFLAKTQRADGRLPGTVKHIVRVLKENGMLPDVSASTVSRHLRARQSGELELRAPAVWMSRRAEVGDVLQLDSSPALLWHLDDEKGFRQRSAKEMWDLQGKPEAHQQIRRHLIRYFATDVASNLWAGRYQYESGESWLSTVSVLLDAFELMGIPRLVIFDRGAGNIAYETKLLLWLLGVEFDYKGGSKNTLGAVEGVHNNIQTWLEFRWAMAPPRSLAQANEQLVALWRTCVREFAHTRSGHTRMQMFGELKPGAVRVCPPRADLLACLHCRPEERNVDGEGVFSFGGPQFLVEGRALRNTRQWVALDPWRAPDAVVLVGYDPETLTCEQRIPATMLTKDYLGYWTSAEQPRWGIGEHPVGTTNPDHAEALSRAAKAATALQRNAAVDWYADLGGLGPIAATPEGAAIRDLVSRRAEPARPTAVERLVPSGEAVRRAVAGIRDRARRSPGEGEVAVLLSWEGREGIAAEEIEALVGGASAPREAVSGDRA